MIKRLLLVLMLMAALAAPVSAGGPVSGIASHYGPGGGVAMNFCTWTHRHAVGCGYAQITSADTGRVVTVPIIDYCFCVVGNSVRIVDLQWDVVAALGLDLSRGLYPVTVELVDSGPTTIPDTSIQQKTGFPFVELGIMFILASIVSLGWYIYLHAKYGRDRFR